MTLAFYGREGGGRFFFLYGSVGGYAILFD
jgi:hypothetical protein